MPFPVHGHADPKFARLKDAFTSTFADGLEKGAGVAVMVDGKLVADLWGGAANAAGTKPWREDTLVNVWSVTKGVVALAVAMLVERGKLQYDAPIAKHWPEFAANGKERVSLDQTLSHTAGLHGLTVPMDRAGLCAWTPYVNALAVMAPIYEPGTRHVYHALTYGHLAGEPLRRADGRSIGRFISEEIAGPLGVPFFVGLPESEDHRAAEMIEGAQAADWVTEVSKSPFPQASANPAPVATDPNLRAFRAAEIPGGNGQATAGALATIYGGLANGKSPLLSKQGLAAATRIRFDGMDESFNLPAKFGAGFRIDDPDFGGRGAPGTFGHAGWGGSITFGDTDAKVGFAFVTSHMLGFDTFDPRRKRLVDAVYDAL